MIRIGILGGADIAFRMFMPALKEVEGIECAGVASNNKDRRAKFEKEYGVKTYDSYEEILNDSSIDAIYVPLPPALHYKWAKMALEKGKHVFLEKPSTIDYKLSEELIHIADEKELVLQENYMFQYHSQIEEIKKIISSGRIGKVRLLKGSFGFPKRGENDFRYNKELGGGALMDAGGYVIKLATLLLGDSIKLCSAQKQLDENYDVDIFDSVMFKNKDGLTYQGAFGMDCHYQCSLEVWGSTGKLFTNRIFTAPAGFISKVIIEDKNGQEEIELKEDKHFKHSIEHFYMAISDKKERDKMKKALLLQAKLVTEVREKMEE